MIQADFQAHLTRAEIWTDQLKEVLLPDLMGMNAVDWLSNFPDGDQINIPSVGQASVQDYAENEPITFQNLDTGEFTFSITEYLSSGHFITKKAQQDSFYAERLEAMFVPKQRRAIEERLEEDMFELQGEQTAGNTNTINGAAHRMVAGGTVNSATAITFKDFAKAKFALDKAHVPAAGRVAIVDPSVEFTLNTLTNITALTNDNQMYDDVVQKGFGTGTRFFKNIYGFDVWVSNFLDEPDAETIDSVASAAGNGVMKANMFFSLESSVKPFVGAWRQMPEVDADYNMQRQRYEYVTTCRYGLKLFRPENLVTVLTSTDVIA